MSSTAFGFDDITDGAFPSFEQLGGSAVLSNTVRDALFGIGLISGSKHPDTLELVTALAHELVRDGRRVVAVRSVESDVIPGISQMVSTDFDGLLADTLIEDYAADVVIIEGLGSPQVAKFAVTLAQSGVMVICSLSAADAASAVSKFLSFCGTDNQQMIAGSLLFSYWAKYVAADSSEATGVYTSAMNVSLTNARRMILEANNSTLDASADKKDFVLESQVILHDARLRDYILKYPNSRLGIS